MRMQQTSHKDENVFERLPNGYRKRKVRRCNSLEVSVLGIEHL